MKFFWQKAEQPKETRRFIFEPKKNITAYELAKLLPLYHARPYRTQESFAKEIDALPKHIKRHIKVIP